MPVIYSKNRKMPECSTGRFGPRPELPADGCSPAQSCLNDWKQFLLLWLDYARGEPLAFLGCEEGECLSDMWLN